MKINKKMIDKVLNLSDEQLWNAIQLFAKKSGVDSITSMEKPQDMTKIRATLAGLSDDDIGKITEMLSKRGKNGWF